MADPDPGRHLQSLLALACRDRAAVMVATPPAWVKLNATPGTFSTASPYSMIRGRYEGLLYKPTHESLDSSRRSRRDACLSDRPDRDSDSGPCGRVQLVQRQARALRIRGCSYGGPDRSPLAYRAPADSSEREGRSNTDDYTRGRQKCPEIQEKVAGLRPEPSPTKSQ